MIGVVPRHLLRRLVSVRGRPHARGAQQTGRVCDTALLKNKVYASRVARLVWRYSRSSTSASPRWFSVEI